MSIRDCYEAVLIELNKVQAPSMLLDDFVYFFNKAVLNYFNKRYNLFETKQQLTDDLRVLMKSKSIKITGNPQQFIDKTYTCELPSDYIHILNCTLKIKQVLLPQNACTNSQSKSFFIGANKLDSTQWSHINENYYMKPSIKRPYYYIMNIDDPVYMAGVEHRVEDKNDSSYSDHINYNRYGNSVQPIVQIKIGDDMAYALEEVYIDYLRSPIYYYLDKDLLDDVKDNTQIIEFPDYVVYAIINEVTQLFLENTQNQRIQTHIPVNQTIV